MLAAVIAASVNLKSPLVASTAAPPAKNTDK
jgi:hypothetical protein